VRKRKPQFAGDSTTPSSEIVSPAVILRMVTSLSAPHYRHLASGLGVR
jgi:hypothetical protein